METDIRELVNQALRLLSDLKKLVDKVLQVKQQNNASIAEQQASSLSSIPDEVKIKNRQELIKIAKACEIALLETNSLAQALDQGGK